MFYRYVALVKNLRGVIYSRLEPDDFSRMLKFVVKRFKYRNIGIPPQLYSNYREYVESIKSRSLVNLFYPVSSVKKGIEYLCLMEKDFSIEIETLCLASVFISPLIILGEDSLAYLRRFIRNKILSSKSLDLKNIKLHLRIVDYSILDAYVWSTENGLKYLKAVASGEDYSKILKERESFIEKDIKRYWRIKEKAGKTIVIYADILDILKTQNIASKLMEIMGEDAPSILSVISGFILNKNMIS